MGGGRVVMVQFSMKKSDSLSIIIIIIIIYDRDSKDLHAGICTNPQKGAQCINRMIDLSD